MDNTNLLAVRMQQLTSILCFLFSLPVYSESMISVTVGTGLGVETIQSDAISNSHFYEISYATKLFEHSSSSTEIWFEVAGSDIEGDHAGQTERLKIIQIKPVLRWQPFDNKQGYLEFAAGVARFSEDSFHGIRYATQTNFALHAGAGYRLKKNLSVSLRYSHFSNAYIHDPNPGLDYAGVTLMYYY